MRLYEPKQFDMLTPRTYEKSQSLGNYSLVRFVVCRVTVKQGIPVNHSYNICVLILVISFH